MLKTYLKRINYVPLASWAMAQYLKFVRLTCRVEFINQTALETLMAEQDSFIIAMWHEQTPFFALNWTLPKWHGTKNAPPMTAFVSSHRDGQLIGLTMAKFGHKLLNYDKKAPLKGLLSAKKTLEYPKCYMAFSPDGPRGPRREAKAGIFYLAKKTNRPIIACANYTKHAIRLNSWDRLTIPLPFGKIICAWEEPIFPDKIYNNDFQEAQISLSHKLNQLIDQAQNASI